MNIRIHIILPLIVILNFNGISQITTFNRNLVFIHDTLNESISGVAELNGRYYVAGYVGQYTNKISITEIDLSGSRLWVKYYGDSTLQQFPGENHAIIATTDGNLVVTGESFIWTPPYTASVLLMKVTPEGVTLWSRTLNRNPVPGEFNRGKGLIETSDQGFAVFGDGRLGGVIYKTDRNGTVQWTRSIVADTLRDVSIITSLREFPGKKFIVSGHWIYPPLWNDEQNGFLYLLDSLGQTIWSDSVAGDYHMHSAPDRNSGAVVLSCTRVPPGHDLNRIHFSRYTSDGILTKQKWFGDSITIYFLSHLFVLPDSTYLLIGVKKYDTSFIFNINRDGDSLFYRQYYYPTAYPSTIVGNFLTDGIPCSDGGLLFGGEFDSLDHSTIMRTGWILKTDRYGCMEPGCDPYGIYIMKQPQSDTLYRYDTVFMTVLATGDSLSYAWYHYAGSGWVAVSDPVIYRSNQDTLAIYCKELPPGEYRFRCRISNSRYSLWSDEAILRMAVGIHDAGQTDNLAVFPNPFTNIVTVLSSDKIKGLQITDCLGKDIYSRMSVEHNKVTLEMDQIPSGLYLLKLITENGIILRRLVKN